ncbi:hypothetical protein OS493_023598 [Desmophyllum pertusum]|uniref:Uncharacterized protein n=1 Tax=Desmophyllum pertusum TaxID=174260 RepID=A0A9X0CYN4_9CNID|nr:hypothetical protein OS493_023598 [Desmophyllum pertusum]
MTAEIQASSDLWAFKQSSGAKERQEIAQQLLVTERKREETEADFQIERGLAICNNKRGNRRVENRMTCKFGKGCTFAARVEELTAWNEHLKRMEKEVGKKSEEEKKKEQNKDGDSAAKSKFKDLVSSLPEVTVTCEPKDPNISLQVPLDSEGEKTYSWTLRLFYEVRLMD